MGFWHHVPPDVHHKIDVWLLLVFCGATFAPWLWLVVCVRCLCLHVVMDTLASTAHVACSNVTKRAGFGLLACLIALLAQIYLLDSFYCLDSTDCLFIIVIKK